MSFRNEKLLILFFLFLSCLIYFNSFSLPFIFDDYHMIVDNIFIRSRQYSYKFFTGYVTSTTIQKGMLRPFLMVTLAFNYWAGKLNPLGYHVVNIFLHFLNAGVFYFLFKFFLTPYDERIKKISGLGVIITLLFLSHPLNTETVNYISSRSDLMVTLFIGLGFLNYLKKRCLFFAACYISALLSKETGLCLPILILAYEFIFNARTAGFSILKVLRGKKEKKFCYAAILLITIGYLIYKNTVFRTTFSVPLRSCYSNILIQSAVTFFYLRLFLFPYPLSIFHYFPNLNTIFTPAAFLSIMGIILLIVTALFFRRRNSLLSFGIAWYLICLLPKFYARLQFTACEHHFYLPSIGVYLVLLVLLRKLYLVHRRYFTYAAVGLIAVFTILVWFRNYEYHDILNFWEIERKKEPKATAIYNILGTEYIKRKEWNKAEEMLERAAGLAVNNSQRKEYWFAKVNLASIYLFKGRTDESLVIIKEAIEVLPYHYMPYQLLGDIYIKQGKYSEAQDAWNKSLYYNSYAPDTYDRLTNFYLGKRDWHRAQDYANKAITAGSAGYFSYFALGYIYESRGELDEAVKFYQQSLLLNREYFYSHYRLGMIYVKIGNKSALEELKKARELNPRAAFVYNDLAVASIVVNPPDWKSAETYAQKAKALGYLVKEDFLKLIEKNINLKDAVDKRY